MTEVLTKGLVLRTVDYRDSDRMLTIFSPEYGAMSILSRGCRKQKAKLRAASQIFACGEFEIKGKADRYYLTGAKIEESFFEISSDAVCFAAGSYILNLSEQVIYPEQENFGLYNLLILVLKKLCNAENFHEIVLFFELRIMVSEGFSPWLIDCTICGGNEMPYYFDIKNGGLLCADCHSIESSLIKAGTLATLRYMLEMDINKIDNLIITDEIKMDIDNILSAYVRMHMDKSLKSRHLFEKIAVNKFE